MHNVYIQSYGALTTHGIGVAPLFQALTSGTCAPKELPEWDLDLVQPLGHRRAFLIESRNHESVAQQLTQRLLVAWTEALKKFDAKNLLKLQEKYAVIFASTKGCHEDYIWNEKAQSLINSGPASSAANYETNTYRSKNGKTYSDPYTEILEGFLEKAQLKPSQYFTISNACASSHSALHLAREFIVKGQFSYVVVLATDWIGPFVQNGFHSLRALSAAIPRPFAQNRDGLLLGEAAAVMILSADKADSTLLLSGSGMNAEGYAATRPQGSGQSLLTAIQQAHLNRSMESPDFILAHATATLTNDAVENKVFEIFPNSLVTGTKWSVGHTLGASGLVDTLVAAEVLKTGKLFPIATCEALDPLFTANIAQKPYFQKAFNSALVTSLGFGGIHAALRLERA